MENIAIQKLFYLKEQGLSLVDIIENEEANKDRCALLVNHNANLDSIPIGQKTYDDSLKRSPEIDEMLIEPMSLAVLEQEKQNRLIREK